MKIRIITDREPWIDNRPALRDEEHDVSEEAGKSLIEAGFAEAVAPKKKAAEK